MHRRWLLISFLGIAASLMPSDGRAEPYRWCAVYTGHAGGAQNCGFVTLEQCRATIIGMGGFCTENQFYTGPAASAPRRKRVPH